VTGGAGYIGSHMVWELLDAGEDVVMLDRPSTGFEWAVAPEARLVVGDVGDTGLVASIMRAHQVDAVIHFAGSIVVPESVADSLACYENNTSKTRALLEAVVRENAPHFIFSSTAAVYGAAGLEPVREDAPLAPASPFSTSKLMSEWMLRDAAAAHGFRYTALRYFKVSGADPRGRTGQSTPGATHLIKVACETATGKRPWMQIFGSDYPTPDGTCIPDDIHVSDLVAAHRLALQRLRAGGGSLVANCGYSHGYSVLEVIDRCAASTAPISMSAWPAAGPATPRWLSPICSLPAVNSAGRRNTTISSASSPMRSPGRRCSPARTRFTASRRRSRRIGCSA
jgi:UDP-glucose 4-epimerase